MCVETGCQIAILCSDGSRGSNTIPGFDGFPPPEPPPGPPPNPDGDSPNGSANPSPSYTGSSPSSIGSIASSSTSPSQCSSITTVADPGPTSAEDPDNSSRRLRLRYDSKLVARDAPVIRKVGECTLTREVKIPLYLGYQKAMNLKKHPSKGANGRIYNAIEKWYTENLATNGTPFSGIKLDNSFNDKTGPGSTDHVWEKSNPTDFLSFLLLRDDFDCDDLNALFGSCGFSLQIIYDQLPSMNERNEQTGFAFMNRNLNGMKGWMFSRGFARARFKQIYSDDNKVLQGLERQAIIFNLFNTDSGIQSMHNQANNRFYSIFLALDDFISANNVQRARGRGPLKLKFGPTFKTWYGQLLTDIGTETYKWASTRVTRLDADEFLGPCLQKAISVFQYSGLYGK